MPLNDLEDKLISEFRKKFRETTNKSCKVTVSNFKSSANFELDAKIPLEDILKYVFEYLYDDYSKNKIEEVFNSKLRKYNLTKQFFSFIANINDYSLKEVGKAQLSKDHTTIIHQLNDIDVLLHNDKNVLKLGLEIMEYIKLKTK